MLKCWSSTALTSLCSARDHSQASHKVKHALPAELHPQFLHLSISVNHVFSDFFHPYSLTLGTQTLHILCYFLCYYKQHILCFQFPFLNAGIQKHNARVVVHSYNPSIEETEARGLTSRPA